MKLQDFKKDYEKLGTKKNLSGKEALEAVKQDGDALRHVDSEFFIGEEEIIELHGKKYKLIE